MFCLPGFDLRRMTKAQRRLEHWRSAEVMRFMGWNCGAAAGLGEATAAVRHRSGRPAARNSPCAVFFGRLHRGRRNLRGAQPETPSTKELPTVDSRDRVRDRDRAGYPIDHLRLTLYDRHAAMKPASEPSMADSAGEFPFRFPRRASMTAKAAGCNGAGAASPAPTSRPSSSSASPVADLWNWFGVGTFRVCSPVRHDLGVYHPQDLVNRCLDHELPCRPASRG